MITCKEDLMNTYIVKGDDALTKAYISACKEYVDVYALQCDRWPKDRHLYFNPKYKHIQSGECDTSKYKEITIKDLKPTPTKFVKVEESIFDLKGEFERGELYFSEWGEEKSFAKIKKEHRLMNNLNSGNVYRQVEINWRDEVKEVYDAVELPSGEQGSLYMGEDWDEQEFIKFCHLVASLTEKPEGV